MQTRSKTRRALSRSTSLDSHGTTLEVIRDDQAIIEHTDSDDASMPLALAEHRNPPRTAQEELLNIVQAQAYAQAATQLNTEARIHHAFVQTEARLQATAHALVQAHGHEQAIETRRDLEEGIQKALVEAHTHAHEQAMAAAQERLGTFMKDIHEKIQSQLSHAVNDVDTKGVAYLESMATKRFESLGLEVEKRVQNALSNLKVSEQSANIQRQVNELLAELPRKLEDSEKRSRDGAISTASAHAERIVSQAEARLEAGIENRLVAVESKAESVVRATISRAETHCNVIEKRTNDSVERALHDLRSSVEAGSRATEDTTRVFDLSAVPALDDRIAGAVRRIVKDDVEPSLRALISSKSADQLDDSMSTSLQLRVRRMVKEMLGDVVREQLPVTVRPLIEAAVVSATSATKGSNDAETRLQVEAILLKMMPAFVEQQLECRLWPRVEASLSRSSGHLTQRFEDQVQRCTSQLTAAFTRAQDSKVAGSKGCCGSCASCHSNDGRVSDKSISSVLSRTYSKAAPVSNTKFENDSDLLPHPRAILAAREHAVRQPAIQVNHGSVREPKALGTLLRDDISNFIREYTEYSNRFGFESWTRFVKPSVLSYLRTVECDEATTDEQVFEHLSAKVSSRASNVAHIERKFREVKIDPHATDATEKIESILLGVEDVLSAMSGAASGAHKGLVVPLPTQVDVILEKLPPVLAASVRRRLKFSPPCETKRAFVSMLFDEAKHFSWPAGEEKKSQLHFKN